MDSLFVTLLFIFEWLVLNPFILIIYQCILYLCLAICHSQHH